MPGPWPCSQSGQRSPYTRVTEHRSEVLPPQLSRPPAGAPWQPGRGLPTPLPCPCAGAGSDWGRSGLPSLPPPKPIGHCLLISLVTFRNILNEPFLFPMEKLEGLGWQFQRFRRPV